MAMVVMMLMRVRMKMCVIVMYVVVMYMVVIYMMIMSMIDMRTVFMTRMSAVPASIIFLNRSGGSRLPLLLGNLQTRDAHEFKDA